MKKKIKIIGFILIILILGLGLVYFFSKKEKPPEVVNFSGLEVPEISLPSDVEIGDLNLDGLNIGAELPSDLFGNISLDANFGGYEEGINLNKPVISFDAASMAKVIETFSKGNKYSGKSQKGGGKDEQSEVSESQKQNQDNTSQVPINQTICAQFHSVPSCSYVPQQYQDLCKKCKAQGY